MRKIIAALGLWLALAGGAAAQTCASYPFTFTSNTTIRSAQVNSNFTSILTCANTLLAPLANPTFTGTVTIPTLSIASPLAVASGGTGLGTLTATDLLVGNGTASPTFIAPGSQGQALISSGAAWGAGVPVLRSYLAGMGLANDGTTPISVLDIAAGQAADSTNVSMIALGQTFFKSTGGSWAAGAGTAGSPKTGMGNGLTVANGTWYHVCAIINAAAADVYFDTDAACTANSPASTTARRRVGSFLTDGAAHILAFKQVNDWFFWKASVLDVNAGSITTTPGNSSITVPTGVNVTARVLATIANATVLTTGWFYAPLMNDEAANTTDEFNVRVQSAGNATATQIDIPTDTSAHVRSVANSNTGAPTQSIRTLGWQDYLGRLN